MEWVINHGRSREFLEDDQDEDDLEPPPNEVPRSHLSPSGLLPLLPHRSASGGGAAVASAPARRNLGIYFPGAGAVEFTATAGRDSNGRAGGS